MQHAHAKLSRYSPSFPTKYFGPTLWLYIDVVHVPCLHLLCMSDSYILISFYYDSSRMLFANLENVGSILQA